jgi:serine/threonine protein kinase
VQELLFFSMECVTQGTRLEYVNRSGGLQEDEGNRLFKQIYTAIRHVHVFHFLVHCDLKLENVMLDAHGNIRVIDFGLAETFYCNTLKTYVGTPGYIAPEVLAEREYGGQCDVWSLGICLFRMFFGQIPFSTTRDYLALVEQATAFTVPRGVSRPAADLITGMPDPRVARRVTIIDIQTHPWMRGVNVVPRPIVFYVVHKFKDVLQFRHSGPEPTAGDVLARAAAVCGVTEEAAAQILKAGLVNDVTTTYFVMLRQLTEKPKIHQRKKEPERQKPLERLPTRFALVRIGKASRKKKAPSLPPAVEFGDI